MRRNLGDLVIFGLVFWAVPMLEKKVGWSDKLKRALHFQFQGNFFCIVVGSA